MRAKMKLTRGPEVPELDGPIRGGAPHAGARSALALAARWHSRHAPDARAVSLLDGLLDRSCAGIKELQAPVLAANDNGLQNRATSWLLVT